MASVPVAERPPRGLDAHHLGVWRHALKTLKERDAWQWEKAPLLAEYVYALQAARDCREGFKWLDALEAYAEDAADLPAVAWTSLDRIAGGLPTQWDRHTKRAAALAKDLELLQPAVKAAAAPSSAPGPAPTARGALDELAARRRSS